MARMTGATGVQTNRTDIQLPKEVSSEIWAKTLESSAVMQLARRITMPGNGVTIPMITSDPTAQWVNETAAKPVSNPEVAKKNLVPYKLAVIVPFSNEFRRDAAALYDALVSRLPNVLGAKFDETVFFGSAPGSDFDTLAEVTAQSLTGASGAYAGLVAAYADIAEHYGNANGIAISPAGKAVLLNSVDQVGHPLFTSGVASDAPTSILGQQVRESRAAYKSGSPNIVGFMGDWTKAVYGTVEGVQVDISKEATLDLGGGNTINLFQQNMFAVRAEIEVAFGCEADKFNALTASASGSTGETGATGET